jgi:hypothetical protein
MQVFCKLYLWDSASSGWKEKGKGNLRLNDRITDDRTCSRLIMRTSGSYKLILNCLLVHGMKFEITTDCLRFSTVDGIHIIKGKTSELDQLHSLVSQRLRDLPKRVKADRDSDLGHSDESSGNSEDTSLNEDEPSKTAIESEAVTEPIQADEPETAAQTTDPTD